MPLLTPFLWVAPTQNNPDVSVPGTLDDELCDGSGQSNPIIGLNNLLSVPGPLHVLHNADNRMLSTCPRLNESVGDLEVVCKVIGTYPACDRLCEACFSDPVGRQRVPELRSFKGTVHNKIWGTGAHANGNLLPLKPAMTRNWNLERWYSVSSTRRPHTTRDDDNGAWAGSLSNSTGSSSQIYSGHRSSCWKPSFA